MFVNNLLQKAAFAACWLKSICERRWLWILCAIIALSLLPRAAMLHSISLDTYLSCDGGDYLDIAKQICDGNGFSVSTFRWCEAMPPNPPQIHPDFMRPPLLPLLGAPLYLLPWDVIISSKAVCLLLSIITIAMVFALGSLLLDKDCALLGTALFAFSPFSIYYSSWWSTENLFLCLFLGTLIFVVKGASKKGTPADFAWAGLLLGLTTLARPTGMLLLPPLLLVAAWASWRKFKLAAPLFLAVALLTLSPWAIRNWRTGGSPTPMTFFGPYALWLGVNETTYEMYRNWDSPGFQKNVENIFTIDNAARIKELQEKGIYSMVEAAPYWKAWAIEYIKNNPEKAAYILMQRFVHYWRLAPNQTGVSKIQWLAALLSTGFLYALSAFALIMKLRREPKLLILVLPVFFGLAISLPFVFTMRYRHPFFTPFLSLLAAYGCIALLELFSAKAKAAGGNAQPEGELKKG